MECTHIHTYSLSDEADERYRYLGYLIISICIEATISSSGDNSKLIGLLVQKVASDSYYICTLKFYSCKKHLYTGLINMMKKYTPYHLSINHIHLYMAGFLEPALKNSVLDYDNMKEKIPLKHQSYTSAY